MQCNYVKIISLAASFKQAAAFARKGAEGLRAHLVG
jgi:hypothetical protein